MCFNSQSRRTSKDAGNDGVSVTADLSLLGYCLVSLHILQDIHPALWLGTLFTRPAHLLPSPVDGALLRQRTPLSFVVGDDDLSVFHKAGRDIYCVAGFMRHFFPS